jgi:Acyl-CoA dehydrogenase, C-terminal domain
LASKYIGAGFSRSASAHQGWTRAKSPQAILGQLSLMAAEIRVARQITYFTGRAKDEGWLRDLEAGMAKLLAARVAWTAADNALQIRGGNGFALEYPISGRLCDARILNIFEGAAEIQAQVIARRLLNGGIKNVSVELCNSPLFQCFSEIQQGSPTAYLIGLQFLRRGRIVGCEIDPIRCMTRVESHAVSEKIHFAARKPSQPAPGSAEDRRGRPE